VLARDSTIRFRVHLASPSFPEHHTSFFRPTYTFDRRMRRKCCALFLFVAVASDAARLLRHGPPQKAAMFAVKNEGEEK
jgi:hypothetical protein